MNEDALENGPQRPLRVLIVDDEERIADTLAVIVRNWGYEGWAEHAGEPAMRAASCFNPDVLLTDLMMPKMDGLALAEQFYRRRPECRIIFMSGNAASEFFLAKADEQGYRYQLLVKPFHPQELLGILEKMSDEDLGAID